MSFEAPYQYQWQDPNLRSTIYPFREEKLRDFLRIYREIDLMREMKGKPVDPKLAAEVIQERSRLEQELAMAKLRKDQAVLAVKTVEQKYRQVLRQPEVMRLVWQRQKLENDLAGLESKRKQLERQVDWYQRFAPEHPYYERWRNQLEALKTPYQQKLDELNKTRQACDARVGPYENEVKAARQQLADNSAKIKELTDGLRKIPPVTQPGQVSPATAVRWQVTKYERALIKIGHDQLLEAVMQRFVAEPQRFPKWLQYMVVHFSGMRYRSAHGSWANPRDLLEMLELDDLKGKWTAAGAAEVGAACTQAINELKSRRSATSDPALLRTIDKQIRGLSSSVRVAELIKYQSLQVVQALRQISDQKDILGRLEARKDQFPAWMWSEIVSRTDLKLKYADQDWETLTPQEQRERWLMANDHWREMMNFWLQKSTYGWREEHRRTLSLIVTRAMCNEVSEHIHHLRGLKPGGGLSARPSFYFRTMKRQPGQAYFRQGNGASDFKPGASIMWMAYVNYQPPSWQAVSSMPGISLPGSLGRVGGGWLRWTHEAVVVEAADMATGTYVLTFETGKIGLNLRWLGHVVGKSDVFVGWAPDMIMPEINKRTDEMIDLKTILPTGWTTAVSFGLPQKEEAPLSERKAKALAKKAMEKRQRHIEQMQRWEQLDVHEKEVVMMVCRGLSTEEMAKRLKVSPRTAQKYIGGAMHKFGVRRRAEFKQAMEGWRFGKDSITSRGG